MLDLFCAISLIQKRHVWVEALWIQVGSKLARNCIVIAATEHEHLLGTHVFFTEKNVAYLVLSQKPSEPPSRKNQSGNRESKRHGWDFKINANLSESCNCGRSHDAAGYYRINSQRRAADHKYTDKISSYLLLPMRKDDRVSQQLMWM